MSDLDAFLACICNKPEDDAPRLVLADWLDENSRSDWAELIRLQLLGDPKKSFKSCAPDRLCRECQLAVSVDFDLDGLKTANLRRNGEEVIIARGMPWAYYGPSDSFLRHFEVLWKWPIVKVVPSDVPIVREMDAFRIAVHAPSTIQGLLRHRWPSMELAARAVSDWYVGYLRLPF